jgi:hypothetical protein
MTAAPGIPRPSGTAASGAPGAPGPAPAANGGTPAARKQASEFPVRLTLNLTPAMQASLQRLRRRMRLKEAVIGRIGLMTYFAANDPHYREDD